MFPTSSNAKHQKCNWQFVLLYFSNCVYMLCSYVRLGPVGNCLTVHVCNHTTGHCFYGCKIYHNLLLFWPVLPASTSIGSNYLMKDQSHSLIEKDERWVYKVKWETSQLWYLLPKGVTLNHLCLNRSNWWAKLLGVKALQITMTLYIIYSYLWMVIHIPAHHLDAWVRGPKPCQTCLELMDGLWSFVPTDKPTDMLTTTYLFSNVICKNEKCYTGHLFIFPNQEKRYKNFARCTYIFLYMYKKKPKFKGK